MRETKSPDFSEIEVERELKIHQAKKIAQQVVNIFQDYSNRFRSETELNDSYLEASNILKTIKKCCTEFKENDYKKELRKIKIKTTKRLRNKTSYVENNKYLKTIGIKSKK